MSITNVRSYFRTHMTALSFTEWKDALNFDNIPSNILDKSFHIETGDASGIQHNQIDLEIEQRVTLRIFRKAYRDTSSGIDSIITDAETAINRLLKPEYRLTGNLKNLIFESMSVTPISDSNDNKIIAALTFRALVILNPN